MPKNYYGSHLDLVCQISQALGNNPMIEKYQNENDFGYINNVYEYLNSNDEGQEIVLDQAINHKKDIPTASGMSIIFADFTKEDTKIIPHMLDYSAGVISDILEDKTLMEQEPQMNRIQQ